MAIKKKQNFLFLFFIIIVFISNLFSQNMLFTNLSVKDGLSNNKISTVIQDKKGFLWFGTEDGLNRFDGYNFKVYRNNPSDSNSISNNNIWSLMEDEQGDIWIGTKSGELNCYNYKTDSFRHWKIKSESVSENSITAIHKDKKGVFWIGTYQSGLYRFNIKSMELTNWKYEPGNTKCLSNNFVTDIVEDNHGNLWISTYNGLNKFSLNFDNGSFTQFYSNAKMENSLSNNLVWSLTNSSNDSNLIWVGTANGLVSLNINKNIFSRISLPAGKNLQFSNSVASVVEDKINNKSLLWIGTYGGLVRLNLDGSESVRFTKNERDPARIVSNEINKMIKDHSGVIWLATEDGLSYFSQKSMKFNSLFIDANRVNVLKELFSTNVKCMNQHSDGKIIFGTSKGVFGLNTTIKKTGLYKNRKTDTLNIWSMANDYNDNIWIGTYGQGLKQLNWKNGNLKDWIISSPTFKTSAYDYIKSLLVDKNNKLWIGFWGGGLARLNPENGNYEVWINDSKNANSISFNDIWVIYQDRKKRVWIGTNGGGLNLFDDSDGVKFIHWIKDRNHPMKLSSNSIYSICESTKGKYSNIEDYTILWIGTSNGLNKLVIKNTPAFSDNISTNIEFTLFTSENGLADNSVKSIVEDENGNLWLGTNSGITFFNIEKEFFINFSATDGLNGNEFHSGAALRADDGLMYFGSINGLNVFNPNHIIQSTYVPHIVITDFQIFNQPVKISEKSSLKENILEAKEIILTHEENVFSFQFSALDYNSPQAIQYAYIMENFDKDWIYSGNRRYVTYTNLDPGNYIFKVKATNSDGIWGEGFKSIMITIYPPWWRTGWAYALYIIFIVFGLLFIRKVEMNRSRLQNKLKMREFEAGKQKEIENMKSRFFTNLSHEFRTPLTLIKGPIEELLSGKAGINQEEYFHLIQNNSQKLHELIDQLLELNQLENTSIPLMANQQNLVQLLRGLLYSFESMAKQKNISLSFISQDESIVCWIDRDKLEKIINNLLSNAFKFTSSNGTISVNVNRRINNEQEFAEVIISDTGIGIPEEKLGRIFDRFYQVDDSLRKKYGGSGIGLALVKELVDLHKWEISVKSEIGKGTEFSLKIPLWSSYLDSNEKLIETYTINLFDDSYEQEFAEENNYQDDKSSILIVDDSKDVRIYLNGLLKNDYKIYEANSGDDGIKKSRELLPDLIISDVMMPSMDGIEFCKNIKTDWLTSHIPVILLTAKASIESKMQGLETGADDYITKPFSFKELSVRIKNLLEQRNKLRKKFSTEINIEPSSMAATSLDSEFLQKAFDVAERNMSNRDFNSDAFAKEMYVSRSQFHRKLLAITGQAPGEFFRIFRLKQAASLILENRLSITQIAFEVGFNSPSHFTKAFRQQFNCLPSEFVKKTNI